MAQDEYKLLKEGDYRFYVYDAKEHLGERSAYVKVGLSKQSAAQPTCWLYISNSPSARRVWKRKLGEYGQKARIAPSYFDDKMRVVDFMYLLKYKRVLLNIQVKHRTMPNGMIGLDIQLRQPNA